MTTSFVRVKAKVDWTGFIDEANRHWIAECPSLKLVVEGDSWQDLMASIDETLDLMLKDLLQTGELDQFLRAHGWQLMQRIPGSRTRFRFDIPSTVKPLFRHDSEAVLS